MKDPSRVEFVDIALSVDVAAIESRLESGCALDAVDEDGYTLLHWLAWVTDDEDADDLVYNRLHRAVQLLLQAGASPHVRTADGRTPLHLATEGDGPNLAAVRLLLQYGSDPNAADGEGRTPLHTAVENSALLCTDALLRTGADWSIRDHAGVSPADLARSTLDLAESNLRDPPDLEPYLGRLSDSMRRAISEREQRSLINARKILALAAGESGEGHGTTVPA